MIKKEQPHLAKGGTNLDAGPVTPSSYSTPYNIKVDVASVVLKKEGIRENKILTELGVDALIFTDGEACKRVWTDTRQAIRDLVMEGYLVRKRYGKFYPTPRTLELFDGVQG